MRANMQRTFQSFKGHTEPARVGQACIRKCSLDWYDIWLILRVTKMSLPVDIIVFRTDYMSFCNKTDHTRTHTHTERQTEQETYVIKLLWWIPRTWYAPFNLHKTNYGCCYCCIPTWKNKKFSQSFLDVCCIVLLNLR